MEGEQTAGHLSEWVEAKPIWHPPQAVELPANDDLDTGPGSSIGEAEGQSFMIEYVDAKGQMSRRRITVWHISESGRDQVPSLYAKCHERNAMRQFRIDRIRCCIDHDGVIYDDVPVFLSECFGMPLSTASRRQEPESRSWDIMIGAIRPDAVLLAAMSRSDGQVAGAEIEYTTQYLVRLVEDSSDTPLTDEEVAKISHFVGRLRPTPGALARALSEARSYPPDRLTKMVVAAARVMDADAVRHPAEIRLLNIVAMELLGIHLFK